MRAETQLANIFKHNPDLTLQFGGRDLCEVVSVWKKVDPVTSVAIGVEPDLIEVTKYHEGECARHSYINITGKQLEGQLPLDVREVLRLIRLGLYVRGLYARLGGGYVGYIMPEICERISDLTASHGNMYVSPKYSAINERRFQEMCEELKVSFPERLPKL